MLLFVELADLSLIFRATDLLYLLEVQFIMVLLCRSVNLSTYPAMTVETVPLLSVQLYRLKPALCQDDSGSLAIFEEGTLFTYISKVSSFSGALTAQVIELPCPILDCSGLGPLMWKRTFESEMELKMMNLNLNQDGIEIS